jgi:transmembrane sensor
MNEIYNNMDDILAKKLAQETTAEEDAIVQNWLKASSKNVQYFEDFEWLWAQTHGAKPLKPVNTEGALQKLHTRMEAAPALKVVKSSNHFFNLSFIMKTAAVLCIAFGIYSQFIKTDPPLTFATLAKPKTDTLLDGSIVTLNKKSSLVLSERFNKRERRMTLTGEAYFEVAHDATRPFVVDVQDLEVKAVGTAFNIDNTTDVKFISILVTDGKVQVASRVETKFVVKGETAMYDLQTGHILIETKQNDNKFAYKTHQFHFDETPLGSVVSALNKAYNVSIILKNKQLEQCPVVVNFDNKTVEEVLTVLGSTCAFKFEKVGEDIILSGTEARNE